MQIALLSCAAGLIATRCAGRRSNPGRESGKNSVKMLDDILFAADHKTVPALRTPDSATCPGVDVVNTFGLEFIGPPDVVNVMGVAPVDDNVALLHVSSKIVQRLIDRRGRYHQPNNTWRL